MLGVGRVVAAEGLHSAAVGLSQQVRSGGAKAPPARALVRLTEQFCVRSLHCVTPQLCKEGGALLQK